MSKLTRHPLKLTKFGMDLAQRFVPYLAQLPECAQEALGEIMLTGFARKNYTSVRMDVRAYAARVNGEVVHSVYSDGQLHGIYRPFVYFLYYAEPGGNNQRWRRLFVHCLNAYENSLKPSNNE